MVSPFAPGGNTDMVGRMIAPRLAERLGQNVLVDNQPGAGGIIGTAAVAKSLPDGHTLLFASGAFTSVAATASKIPYDPGKDFAWVTVVITYPFVVLVRNDSLVRSAAGLVELARRNPGKLSYGSVSVGSVFHLASELFNAMAGTDMLHVPFKGSAEPMTELMAGRLDVIFGTLTGAFAQIQAGRVRALAVTSLERSPQLPDVPTMVETLPGYEVTSFASGHAARGRRSAQPRIARGAEAAGHRQAVRRTRWLAQAHHAGRGRRTCTRRDREVAAHRGDAEDRGAVTRSKLRTLRRRAAGPAAGLSAAPSGSPARSATARRAGRTRCCSCG
jgi:tripartite-type tricarboxylate transporter receptor subunit TctC